MWLIIWTIIVLMRSLMIEAGIFWIVACLVKVMFYGRCGNYWSRRVGSGGLYADNMVALLWVVFGVVCWAVWIWIWFCVKASDMVVVGPSSLLSGDLVESLLGSHIYFWLQMAKSCSVIDSPAESTLMTFEGLLVALEMILIYQSQLKRSPNMFKASATPSLV